ncbi:hypothetical protein X805_03750 [Sphaerotilus natans subsp. natans DSM 6575]|uniref:Uncharacterized protein n=1 Tax=Sphaerotilus natans subsp. natans DSM 6575 TaxID=1286631 RepID=A0A059KRF0_9BURK|nr:hypothetical protein X805_03750 [Sphaerotilus natans subsp. natans DSM 6575]
MIVHRGSFIDPISCPIRGLCIRSRQQDRCTNAVDVDDSSPVNPPAPDEMPGRPCAPG